MVHTLSSMVYGNTLLDCIFKICTKETIQTCMPRQESCPKLLELFSQMAWIVDQDTCRATVFISMKTTDQPEETLKPNNFFQKMMISSLKDYTHFVWNFGHTWYINKTKIYLVAKRAVIFEEWVRHVRSSKLNNCSRSKAIWWMCLFSQKFKAICLCSFQGNEDQSHDIQN